MSEYQPEWLFFAFGSQPLKTLYLFYALFELYLVRIPYWALISIRTRDRPRKSWSFRRTLTLYRFRYVFSLFERIGGPQAPPNHSVMDENPDVNGIWIDPVPDRLVDGDLRRWADAAKVKPIRIPAYWIFAKGSSNNAPPDDSTSASRASEKVILYFHGGAYVVQSGHPHDPVANITRALIDAVAPSIQAALSVEYRLSSGAPLTAANPFPAAVLDAFAGYQYLIKLGYSAGNIIIAGDSAGANLALALTRYVLGLMSERFPGSKEKNVAAGALVLLSPWADLSAGLRTPPEGSSFITNAKSDFLRGPHSQFELYAVHAYVGPLGRSELSRNEYISPASPEIAQITFKDFPRTFILAGDAEFGLDAIRCLRDRMVEDLGKGDSGVVYHEFVDSIHDFLAFDWHEPQRTQALREISAWFDRLFV